jgi:hypothetical protein
VKKNWGVVLLILFSAWMTISPLSYKECVVIGINQALGWATFQASPSDGNAIYALNLDTREITELVPSSNVLSRSVVQAEDMLLIGVMEILGDYSGRLDVYSIEDGQLIFHYEAPQSIHIHEFSSQEFLFNRSRPDNTLAAYRVDLEANWEVTEYETTFVTSFQRPPLESVDLEMLAQQVPACATWAGYSKPSSRG